MAISEFEIKRIEKLVGGYLEKRRPAKHIRSKFDLAFRINNQSFEIYSVRPRWDNPEEILEGSIAKATYVKSRKIWKIYWMRSDLKWHSYAPQPSCRMLEEVLEIIDRDEHSCFWG